MAWGRSGAASCQDLVDKIQDSESDAVYILPFRKVDDTGAAALGAALAATQRLGEFYASGHSLSPAALASLGERGRQPGGQ